MNLIISRLIVVCLVGFVFVASQVPVRAQTKSQRPLRVIVDASKDGGLWWFPQGQSGFDPKQHHQGQALADLMRSKGWEVIELPRGEVITFDKLRDADMVVRPPAFFNYTVEELAAYRDSVMAGTRLLLMGGPNSDAVAEVFGLSFEPRSRFASVKKWIPHPLTGNVHCCNLAWTAVSQAPDTAVMLAWLNQAETNPLPVVGYLPYGEGYVAFVGQSLISVPSDRSFAGSLLNSVARYTLEEMKQFPKAGRVFAEESVGLPPSLIEPVFDATLPQPNTGEWRFDWEDVPGATGYEIVILRRSAAFPLRGRTTTSDFVYGVRDAYIIDNHLLGWSWRVRAQYQNGTWGPWSSIRRFNVSPRSRQ
ncbi:MAG TPA: hypothetical protein VFH31_01770 [Pyrinomonadaceae bacterium]|nr:hypothetical protein [Pyrinomonadaceae bacterium]